MTSKYICVCLFSVIVFTASAGATETPTVRFDTVKTEVEQGVDETVVKRALALSATTKGTSMDDVERARLALQHALDQLAENHFLVTVPAQTISQNTVTLHVSVRKMPLLKALNVTDAAGFTADNIRRSIPSLQVGQPVDLDLLDRQLRLAQTNPSKDLNAKLIPQSDGLSADISTSTARADKGYVTVDNFGTIPGYDQVARINLGYLHGNLSGRDDVLKLNILGQQEASAISTGYTLPLYANAQSIEFYGAYSKSNPGNVDVFHISGAGHNLGLRWNYVLPRFGSSDAFTVSAGYRYSHYDNDVTFNYDSSQTALVPSVSTSLITLGVNGLLNLNVTTSLSADVVLSHNFSGQLASDNSAALGKSRVGAEGNYTLLNYSFSLHTSVADWLLQSNISGQSANRPLVSGEQVYIAGPNAVRGFKNGLLGGDSGVTGRVELITPNLSTDMLALRLYSFYDAGHVARKAAQSGEIASANLSSIGVGMKMQWKFLNADIYYAQKSAGRSYDTTARAGGMWASVGGIF
ncbi:ShlB/FhaC/HecB family hemolysin secretion/activation protein [Undibacterium sp. 5I2]|nr:ShlB/FhaC/HecB family hemolysin secretion/activation protein [Undibacterium sp. 5I2]